MKIKLTKLAKVGTVTRPKGWEGEVDDALGQSIINDRRAVEVGGASKQPPADPPPDKPRRGRPRKE